MLRLDLILGIVCAIWIAWDAYQRKDRRIWIPILVIFSVVFPFITSVVYMVLRNVRVVRPFTRSGSHVQKEISHKRLCSKCGHDNLSNQSCCSVCGNPLHIP